MNKDVILADLNQTTKKLLQVIASFTAEHFNQKPSETAWSPAQVAEHLVKVDSSTIKALSGESIPTNRPPEQKIPLLKGAMEDDTKRVAPDLVLPSGENRTPQELMEQLQTQKELMVKAIEESDMTEACTSFKHPALGIMTKIEWVYFNIYHTERHLKQMQQARDSGTAFE